jgi:hypothetical protein
MKQTTALHNTRSLILIGALAAITATIACSDKPTPVAKLSSGAGVVAHSTDVRPSTSGTVKPVAFSNESEQSNSTTKANSPKFISFKSRDYGISLEYPWQYTALRSKALAENESLRPKLDGSDDQFSLMRIEVPKGFYPDTDLETGYLTVSLNQDIEEAQCKSIVSDDKNDVKTESINGVEFLWKETDSGGRGSASKIRNYVTYQNGTCYELEMGVKTKNDHGFSKEVNTDHVMARLDSILKSVKIKSDESKPELKKVAGSKEDANELVSKK